MIEYVQGRYKRYLNLCRPTATSPEGKLIAYRRKFQQDNVVLSTIFLACCVLDQPVMQRLIINIIMKLDDTPTNPLLTLALSANIFDLNCSNSAVCRIICFRSDMNCCLS
jgi:hypothetical protein